MISILHYKLLNYTYVHQFFVQKILKKRWSECGYQTNANKPRRLSSDAQKSTRIVN